MAPNKKIPCKLCSIKTSVRFNINFKAVPICECCADNIFLQQAKWYTQQEKPKGVS